MGSEMSEVVVGEIVHDETSRELAVRPSVTLVPTTTAQDLVQRLAVIRGAMEQAMQKDVDYGVLPGTGKKPTLLKPGAEKLAVLFQLDVQLDNDKTWHDDGHLTVVSRATVFHIPSGARVASGEGICTTREAKYAYRQGERLCPSCKQPAIIKGKAEYGGGWVCFKRKGGCGRKFSDGDPQIEGQSVGKVANDNIADTYNTVDKMASKRARVDAVLAATGASALFTQDAEELQKAEQSAAPQSAARAGEDRDGWFPPPADADGEASHPESPSPTTPASGSVAPSDNAGGSPSAVITEAQRRRLHAIRSSAGMSEEALKALLDEMLGVTSTKDIPRDRYEALCAAIEAATPEAATDGSFAARAAGAQANREAAEATA